MAREVSGKRGLLILLLSIVAFVALLPLLTLILNSLLQLNTTPFQTTLYTIFFSSIGLSTTVAMLSTSIGALFALLFVKTDFRYSHIILTLLLVPLLLPPFIIALAWIDMLSNSAWLFGFWGVVLVQSSIYLPLAILIIMLFLKQIDANLENMALLHTHHLKLFRYITLPLIKPAIIFSFLLIFVLSFSEISVANTLRYHLFAQESFIAFSAFYDFQSATIMALPMLSIALFIFIIHKLFIDKKMLFKQHTQKINKIKLPDFYQIVFAAIAFFTTLIFVILPLVFILSKSDVSSFTQALTLSYPSLFRSFAYSFLSALLLAGVGFLTGVLHALYPSAMTSFLNNAILFTFILPATLLATALILFYNHPYSNFIYASPMIILFAYLGKFLALSFKISEARIMQIPKSTLQAASLFGASFFDTLRYIILPQSKQTMLMIFFIAFVFCFRDSSLSMMLYPAGYETLPTYIINYMANGSESIIASLIMILILSILLPFFMIAGSKKYA